MRVPVVVSTGAGRGGWVADCLNSIHRGDVTVALSRTGGELGAISMIYEHTRWRRWLLVQDSCVVKDQRFFDMVDAAGGPLLIAPRPCMYLAVYEREALDEIGIPDVPAGADRRIAVAHETAWMDRYVEYAGPAVLFPEFTDDNATRVEDRHGRRNLVLENDYLIKYKGTWQAKRGATWQTTTPPSTS